LTAVTIAKVTKRYWLTFNGVGYRLTKIEPPDNDSVDIHVRAAVPGIAWDAIWIDSERSFDTYVILDGIVTYHVPREDDSTRRSFDQHEAAAERLVLIPSGRPR